MTDGSGNQHYFSYDGLGSVSDLTDGTGAVTDTFVYDVFGAVTTLTGTTANNWKFTGEQADDGTGDSGYYFLRARHYDPATGRFIGRDKVEFSQRYAYADSNPVLWTDPSGMCKFGLPCPAPARWVGEQLGRVATGLSAAAAYCGASADRIDECRTRLEIGTLGTGMTVLGTFFPAVTCTAFYTGPLQPFVCAVGIAAGSAVSSTGIALLYTAVAWPVAEAAAMPSIHRMLTVSGKE